MTGKQMRREDVEEQTAQASPFAALLRGPDVLPSAPLLPPAALAAVAIGEIIALVPGDSRPVLSYAAAPDGSAVVGRTTVALDGSHVGRAAVLVFEGGDTSAPIVIGVLARVEDPGAGTSGRLQASVDGDCVTIAAQRRLVLRCGEASITLTESGRVIVEGTSVTSRAKGANRLQGGSVQIN